MSRAGTRPWDAADLLEITEDMVAYLEAALEQDGPQLVAAVPGGIARAQGMTKVAPEAGPGGESLYRWARISAQRARAWRWGSVAADSSRTSRRAVPEAASRAITAGSSSQGVSTMAGPARRTSSTATSSGVSEWSSRSIGRCVKRTPGQGPGVRPGTAARNVVGTCDVRPSQFAAATPAGPEPRPPSWRATSSILGGDMPSGVVVPFQYRPLRTRKTSPAADRRENADSTALRDPPTSRTATNEPSGNAATRSATCSEIETRMLGKRNEFLSAPHLPRSQRVADTACSP